MEDTSPFNLFVWFVRLQFLLFAPALGVLWLVRRKFGGWDLGDWVVAVAVGIAIAVDWIAVADLEAHYLHQVGDKATGTVSRKWMVEGDDSTTFKAAVQFRGWEDEYSIPEGLFDELTPPMATPVYFDPDYPSDFVPAFRVTIAWDPMLVVGLLVLAAVLELTILGWIGMRVVQRLRAPPGG